MPNPMPCQVVTAMTDTMAAVPLPCQLTSGRPTWVSSWLMRPMTGSNRRRKMMPAATPEITTGR